MVAGTEVLEICVELAADELEVTERRCIRRSNDNLVG
jgi:hypothetical protein